MDLKLERRLDVDGSAPNNVQDDEDMAPSHAEKYNIENRDALIKLVEKFRDKDVNKELSLPQVSAQLPFVGLFVKSLEAHGI